MSTMSTLAVLVATLATQQSNPKPPESVPTRVELPANETPASTGPRSPSTRPAPSTRARTAAPACSADGQFEVPVRKEVRGDGGRRAKLMMPTLQLANRSVELHR
jgi:hypothetical protein